MAENTPVNMFYQRQRSSSTKQMTVLYDADGNEIQVHFYKRCIFDCNQPRKNESPATIFNNITI